MRIALFQMTSGLNPAENADLLVQAAADARWGGAKMLFTPEMSGLMDKDRERSDCKVVFEEDDLVLKAVRQAAAARGIWIHLGSLAVRSRRDEKRRNRGFVIDDKGEIRARYDKIHLFDVDLPTGESWRESSVYGPGGDTVVLDTPIGTLGVSVCYDLRFPSLFAALTNAGAQILAVPAAFTVPTGKAHWHVLLRARSIEAGAFVIAAAQTGEHEDGRKTYGHSLVVDPWGTVLLDAGAGTGLHIVDLPLERIAEIRARIPVLDHRRTITTPARS